MNRRLLVLNLILVALLVWGVRNLRQRWLEARQHEAEVLAKTPKAAPIAPPPSPAPVAPAPAAEYIDVAQRTLFSADRNPNIEIQVEPPKPEPPVPPMPAYHGQMALGTPVILLSSGGPQKGYRVGDDVGEFKILAFDRENLTLGWNGKELSRELRTLAPKEEETRKAANGNAAPAGNANSAKSGSPAARTASAPARNATAPTGAGITQLGSTSIRSTAKNDEFLGPPVGGGRSCLPGDSSPAGTVKNGYKKVVVQSLMGGCFWEPTK